MAEAIPRAEWSEAEEYRERLFYWEYLVSQWLVPGSGVFNASNEATPNVNPPSLQDYGWLHERGTLIEQ